MTQYCNTIGEVPSENSFSLILKVNLIKVKIKFKVTSTFIDCLLAIISSILYFPRSDRSFEFFSYHGAYNEISG
jgi:hypothetical protein